MFKADPSDMGKDAKLFGEAAAAEGEERAKLWTRFVEGSQSETILSLN